MQENHYKRINCRQCESNDLSLAIKLKKSPLANDYSSDSYVYYLNILRDLSSKIAFASEQASVPNLPVEKILREL